MPRIPYVPSEELPDHYDVLDEEGRDLPDSVSAAFWNQQGTVRTFSNNPAMGRAHVRINTELWTETGLSPAAVECVILAVARALESPYIWHDHVLAGLNRVGLSKKTICAISDRSLNDVTKSYRSLITYAFEFADYEGAVTDETHQRVAAKHDDGTIVGLAYLCGFYVSLIHILRALSIEHEAEFVGWELEGYDRDLNY